MNKFISRIAVIFLCIIIAIPNSWGVNLSVDSPIILPSFDLAVKMDDFNAQLSPTGLWLPQTKIYIPSDGPKILHLPTPIVPIINRPLILINPLNTDEVKSPLTRRLVSIFNNVLPLASLRNVSSTEKISSEQLHSLSAHAWAENSVESAAPIADIGDTNFTAQPKTEPSSHEFSKTMAKELMRLSPYKQIDLLGSVFAEMMRQDQKPNVRWLENKLESPDVEVRRSAARALGPIYSAIIERGEKTPNLEPLLARLNDSHGNVTRAAIQSLGEVYLVMAERGEKLDLTVLERHQYEAIDTFASIFLVESRIYLAMLKRGENHNFKLLEESLKEPELLVNNDSHRGNRDLRDTAVNIYVEKVRHRQPVDLQPLKYWLSNSDRGVRLLGVNVLGHIYAEMIQQGERPDITQLIDSIEDFGGLHSLGEVYAAMVKQGIIPDLNPLTKFLDWRDDVGSTLEALGSVYQAMIAKGKSPDLKVFTKSLNSGEWSDREGALLGLGKIYVAMISRGENPNLEPIEEKTKGSENYSVRLAAIPVLGEIYAALIRNGKTPDLKTLETLTSDGELSIRRAASVALGSIYEAKIERGEFPDLQLLESRVRNGDFVNPFKGSFVTEFWGVLKRVYVAMIQRGRIPDLRLQLLHGWGGGAELDTLMAVYAAMIRQGQPFIRPREWQKYNSWTAHNLPFDEKVVDDYFEADDANAFIAELKRQAQSLLTNGFDPRDERQVWLAFIGTRMSQIDVEWPEFKDRVRVLADTNNFHPDTFKALFKKANGLPELDMASDEPVASESDPVNFGVLKIELRKLLDIKAKIDAFSWTEESFPQVKAFHLRNLYYQFERSKALQEGRFKLGERFHSAA